MQAGQMILWDVKQRRTFGYSSQDQYSAFLDFPLLMKKRLFQNRQQHRKQILPENVCQHVCCENESKNISDESSRLHKSVRKISRM